jgi:hypothetical protein
MQIKPKQTLLTTVENMVWVICQLDAKIKPQTDVEPTYPQTTVEKPANSKLHLI